MDAEKCQNLLYIWSFNTYHIYHINTIMIIYLATLIRHKWSLQGVDAVDQTTVKQLTGDTHQNFKQMDF